MAPRKGSQPVSFRTEGLRELRLALRAMDRTLPRELTKEHRKVARMVADEAQDDARASGSTLAKAAPAIVPTATQGGAAIRLDVNRRPFILGAEFGGGRRKTTRQFKAWLGSGGRSGYALFPAIRRTENEQIEMYSEGLKHLIARHFPEGGISGR